MFPLALIQPHERFTEISMLVEAAFMLAVLICFLRVAGYVARKLESGRLLNSRHAPMDFIMPPLWGWLFTGAVLLLVFMQSVYYIFLVFMGLAGLLLENGRTAREQFGFGRLPASILIKWSLLVCGAVLFVETPLSRLWLWVMDTIHIPHPEQQTVEAFRGYRRPVEVMTFMFQAVILFPMIEELFFRGFLLVFLKKYTTTWMALILSAGIFAFAHANLGAVLPLWFLGIVLGVAYQHTGSLLLPFGIHACWNFFTALSLLLDKGNN